MSQAAHPPAGPRAVWRGQTLPLGRRLLLAVLSTGLAAAIWLPCLHLLYLADPATVRAQLTAQQLHLWETPAERERAISRMRRSNAEWDFMGRTFLVLALANQALARPERARRHLAVIDRMIDETIRLEREKGQLFFLMPYARARPFHNARKRSVFVDGEIALMLAARQTVAARPAYRPLLVGRIDVIAAQLRESPDRFAESYPDECWTFCNTIALAALVLSDRLDGRDHSRLIAQWLAAARRKLIDPKTGMLISSFTLRGDRMDGPEGSSIFLSAHMLQLIDPELAADQYRRARAALGRTLLGFGFAREWPVHHRGAQDIDSGPTVPIVGANAGASGLALVGAGAFGDTDYLRSLIASLELAGFPRRTDGRLRYQASNQVGDATMLYALTLGPLWREAGAR